MNAIIAVQDLIKQNRNRIKVLKHQLSEHEEGINRLSAMAEASAELGLEKSQDVLEKNEIILKELQSRDLLELEKEEQLKEAIIRNNYFKYQKVRLKRDLVMKNDQKLEAMMIVDELPEDLNIQDEEIFAIAKATVDLNLRIHSELYDDLKEIKKDWDELLKHFDSQSIDKLGSLNLYIPIIVLQFSVLIANIQENIEEDEKIPVFKGLPAFEDWWVAELWSNHQAYLGLHKWRSIIASLCITAEQKRAWSTIFSNWIFIKKLLNDKGYLGFEYNFAFDSLVEHHTKLKEELDKDNLISMEKIVKTITEKEDFTKYKTTHAIETEYLKFKRDKIDFKA
jgi:hypothetical protein